MIFLIPARTGSKRLVGKNTRPFCGIYLFMWSLATAKRIAKDVDGALVIVSTDDPFIQHVCMEKHVREPCLCSDQATSQSVVDYYFSQHPSHSSLVLLQPTSPTRPDSLVRMMIARGDQCRSVTNGDPNGQCWVYRRGVTEWVDVETEQGHDIDVQADFDAAEADMLKRFQ